MLALRSIARRVLQLTVEERELAREIEMITRRLAPQLLEQPGVQAQSDCPSAVGVGRTGFEPSAFAT
jgi:hypothetical protein